MPPQICFDPLSRVIDEVNAHHRTNEGRLPASRTTGRLHILSPRGCGPRFVCARAIPQPSPRGDSFTEAKRLLDLDRLEAAKEAGYETAAGKLWPHTCTPKNDGGCFLLAFYCVETRLTIMR